MIDGTSKCAKWFERCGLASLEDMESPDLKAVMTKLERVQDDFLSREETFRSPDYSWPRDALHFVARPWEYSYVFSNLCEWRSQHSDKSKLRVMDFGSGVTFFPFALAREDMEVTAVDVDPVVGRDFKQAIRTTPAPAGALRFVLSSEGNRVPEQDSSFSCIYSVSVLEHVPDRIAALRELKRLLQPGGLLIATFDVSLRGRNDFDPDRFYEFMAFVRREFELVWPERTIHPNSLLTCYNGPYPYNVRAYLKSPLAKLGFVGRTLWRNVRGLGPPVDYAFMGIALKKL